MLTVGITGGIASGKSEALKIAYLLGYPTLTADGEIAKIYTQKVVLAQLSAIFKVKIKDKNDVKPIVLADKSKLKILEKVLYKTLNKNIDAFKRRARTRGYKICFLEIPLLFEKGFERRCDFIINIDTPVFIQKRRFLARKKGTLADFYKFTNLQLTQFQRRQKTLQLKGINVLNIKTKLNFRASFEGYIKKLL
jgi:dephospho-CoA kinase